MFEVDEAARVISKAADTDANIIFGAIINEKMSDQIQITVVATGFDETQSRIAQIAREERVAPIQGIVSQAVVSDGSGDDTSSIQEPDSQIEEPMDEFGEEERKDEFGEKFEIPAFLRKVH